MSDNARNRNQTRHHVRHRHGGSRHSARQALFALRAIAGDKTRKRHSYVRRPARSWFAGYGRIAIAANQQGYGTRRSCP